MEGVLLVLSVSDLDDYGGLPTRALLKQPDGSKIDPPPHPLLAKEIVRHVGEPIVFIVAETRDAAKAASEAIEIEYDPLPAVADTAAALDPDAPLVWPETGSNVAFTRTLGDADKTSKAFAEAARVVSIDIVNNRLVANYMEPRGCIGAFDPGTGRYTLTAGTQGGHGMRDVIAGAVLKIDPADLRVVTPDVGGGFGTKTFVYSEYPLCLIAARRLGRPVKWICERTEHFVADTHGRDNLTRAELALGKDGRFLGLKVDIAAAMGAYLHQFGPFIPWVGATMSTGVYDIPALEVRIRGVYAHTTPTDAYRGAGRPEAAYVLERLVDTAASQVGLTPVEIRRRNFIKPEAMPYKTPTGRLYDTGDFNAHMTRALEIADWDGFQARRADSVRRGNFRGIGFATYIEACAFPGSEEATVELHNDGRVSLLIGTQSNGQGHATAYAQVIAEHLGLDFDAIDVIQGDTDRVRSGGGTGGSRSIPLGVTSVSSASQILARKIKEIAAQDLEVGIDDLELAGGAARIIGTDRAMSFAAVTARAREPLQGVDAVRQTEATYPNGTHVCEVEVAPETGDVKILAYTIVDDFGVTVNPLLLAGQVHGGVAQAIGQALLERTVYDEDGQLLTASFLDYAMPRADRIPSFRFETRNIPSTTNALGIKGAGEAGTIGGCPAVMNALVDALRTGAGIVHIDMPATPYRVWQEIQAAQMRAAA